MEKKKITVFLREVIVMGSILRYAHRRFTKISAYIRFLREYYKFKTISKSNRFKINWKDRWPCLDDKTPATDFDRHYVYHTAWAMRVINSTNPKGHIDISSSIYFVALASSLLPIIYFDYRPAALFLDGIECGAADLLSLPFHDESIQSMSCMHVVEHIGLGRYGEPFDSEGDLKAIKELKRVLAKGGQLLFVIPVGRPRVMFNAHRVYSYEQVKSYFEDLELVEFSLIPDNPLHGGLVKNATQKMADAQRYGCGCFWFGK